MAKKTITTIDVRNRFNEYGYRRTKLKELLKGKRRFISLTSKNETSTITGIPINKNGKPILRKTKL